jgi:hypothetical protein
MKRLSLSQLRRPITWVQQQYLQTPQRALDAAYNAAQAIQALEVKHFNGQPLRFSPNQAATATVFEAELHKHLRTIRTRLAEFKASTYFLDLLPIQVQSPLQGLQTPSDLGTVASPELQQRSDSSIPQLNPADSDSSNLLERLQFIDTVLCGYQRQSMLPVDVVSPPISHCEGMPAPTGERSQPSSQDGQRSFLPLPATSLRSVEDSFYGANLRTGKQLGKSGKLENSSFIPRSILRTASRFKKELDPDPNREVEVLNEFRNSKRQTRMVTQFVLLLIITPLLTQQISKNILIGPIVDRIKGPEKLEIMINPEIEGKALNELARFEDSLRFQNLISSNPISSEELEAKLKEKALDLSGEYQWNLTQPIKNILADILSLFVFGLLIYKGRRQIEVLKLFFDDLVYGLSDSAKAFIIILFTDVFVGFHSPHGWEVILESSLEHFGLPQNHSFINMFIATFPVMLDTVIKYWIFRYLNQISPSAVATYRNMNE